MFSVVIQLVILGSAFDELWGSFDVDILLEFNPLVVSKRSNSNVKRKTTPTLLNACKLLHVVI